MRLYNENNYLHRDPSTALELSVAAPKLESLLHLGCNTSFGIVIARQLVGKERNLKYPFIVAPYSWEGLQSMCGRGPVAIEKNDAFGRYQLSFPFSFQYKNEVTHLLFEPEVAQG